MATADMVHTEELGVPGEACPCCLSPLATDQRYCLECGHRRAASRVPYAALLAGREPGDVLPGTGGAALPPGDERWRPSPAQMGAAGGAAVVVLLFGFLVGLLVGGSGDEPPPAVAPVAQKAPVINVTVPTGGGEVVEAEFVEDWPAGESGFTVQLDLLPKDSTDVATVDQAKADAEAAGATDVGALDTDSYRSLEAGNYLVYAGVFTGKGAKAKAQKALKQLKRDFPGAVVVEVTSADEAFGVAGDLPEEQVEKVDDDVLEDLESSTGIEQQKKSAQLPDTLELEGEAPAPDNEQPGGGTGGGETIE